MATALTSMKRSGKRMKLRGCAGASNAGDSATLPLSERDRRWNRCRSKVRARVEHIFQIIKQVWGHRKVRYRGLAKNEAHYFSLLALANLYMVRKKLILKRA